MEISKLNYRIILCVIILPFAFNFIGKHAFLSSPPCIIATSVLLTISLLLNLHIGLHVKDVFEMYVLIVMLWMTSARHSSLGTVFACYNIFMMAFLFNNIKFTKEQAYTIHFLIALFLGLFIIKLDVVPEYDTYRVFQKNGVEININSFGILVLAFYYHFIILSNQAEEKRKKYFLFICATAVTIYLIELSDCRSAYLAIIIFLILALNKNLKMKHYRKILFIAVLTAIIFPFIYLKFSDSLAGLEFGGKSLLTRKYVWESTIKLIKQYPVLGSGTVYAMRASADKTYTSSAHNVFLGLWKTVGLFPMIIFALRLNKGTNMREISKSNIIKKKMFLSCIILCIFETLLNDSNTGLFFMTLLITEKEEEEIYK